VLWQSGGMSFTEEAGPPRYARPYVLPGSLESLAGPVGGVVRLPRHLAWSGDQPGGSARLPGRADAAAVVVLLVAATCGAADVAGAVRCPGGDRRARCLGLAPHRGRASREDRPGRAGGCREVQPRAGPAPRCSGLTFGSSFATAPSRPGGTTVGPASGGPWVQPSLRLHPL
jgi:hypothetical protein